MTLLPIFNREEAWRLASVPRVAVDLGFASKAKSCGLAFHGGPSRSPVAVQFGEAVRQVASTVETHSSIVLILEAPLSATFDALGNPCPRGIFERTNPPRWWSLGAGATVALAALFFLRRLSALTVNCPAAVHLAEGFVVGGSSVEHERVADSLCAAFARKEARWHAVELADEVTSIIDWFQPAKKVVPPAILEPV